MVYKFKRLRNGLGGGSPTTLLRYLQKIKRNPNLISPNTLKERSSEQILYFNDEILQDENKSTSFVNLEGSSQKFPVFQSQSNSMKKEYSGDVNEDVIAIKRLSEPNSIEYYNEEDNNNNGTIFPFTTPNVTRDEKLKNTIYSSLRSRLQSTPIRKVDNVLSKPISIRRYTTLLKKSSSFYSDSDDDD